MLDSIQNLETENALLKEERKYYQEEIAELRQVVSQLTGTMDRSQPRLIHPFELYDLARFSDGTMAMRLDHPDGSTLENSIELDGIRYKQSANMPAGFAHIEVSNFKKPSIL